MWQIAAPSGFKSGENQASHLACDARGLQGTAASSSAEICENGRLGNRPCLILPVAPGESPNTGTPFGFEIPNIF
jgi:hypothetical protein